MTEVIDKLFIGNWHDAQRQMVGSPRMHVVTVAQDSPITGDKKFSLVDGPGNPPELIIEAAKYVAEVHERGEQVLVHCHGGRSRSGVVTTAALMLITKKNLCECYDLLKDQHEITRIHPYLSLILINHEEALR